MYAIRSYYVVLRQHTLPAIHIDKQKFNEKLNKLMKKCKIYLHWWRIPLCAKTCRVMKLILIFVFSGFMAMASSSYSQQANVSLDMKHASIIEIFDVIENQTDYQVAYNSTQLNQFEKVDLNVDNRPISEVLDLLFKNSSVQYEFVGRYIVISDKKGESYAKDSSNSQQTRNNFV